jgi:hypothetical protein
VTRKKRSTKPVAARKDREGLRVSTAVACLLGDDRELKQHARRGKPNEHYRTQIADDRREGSGARRRQASVHGISSSANNC